MLGGVLPTPAVALGALDLGVVITASHNPPEYNGVKFFRSGAVKLSDVEEEQIEALLDAPGAPGARRDRACRRRRRALSRPTCSSTSAPISAGLRVAVDCANGAYSATRAGRFRAAGRRGRSRSACEPDGTNINAGCGATEPALLQRTVVEARRDLGVAFDGDGDRIVAVDEQGALVDGDGIVAILALDLGVDLVAVTQMTNLGFHALMRERGIRVVTTDVGDRYVLEALVEEGGVLGGEQSGHVIYLRDHVAGDGLAAALLLCAALRGRPLQRGRGGDAALRPAQGRTSRCRVEGAQPRAARGGRAR